MKCVSTTCSGPSPEDVGRDVDAMFRSAELCSMIRFNGTAFWKQESIEHEYCERILGGKPRLESVAEHSWHLADAVLLVGPRFPQVDLARSLVLAIMHDKLELWCDDLSPLGRDGSGKKTFAFNQDKRRKRDEKEREAAQRYLRTLSAPVRDLHAGIIEEVIHDATLQARFVRALDKLQVFVYLVRRKAGEMENDHIAFNLRYAKKFVDRCPLLAPYYDELCQRLLAKVAEARARNIDDIRGELAKIVRSLQIEQAELPLNEIP